MPDATRFTRRTSLQSLGCLGAAALLGGPSRTATAADTPAASPSRDVRQRVWDKVSETPLIDTHEHLLDEQDRLQSPGLDDWSVLLTGYLGSDLRSAGMPRDAHGKLFSMGPSPGEKWQLLEPYWPAVKHTGYGQAARLSIRELYGVDELSAATVEEIQRGYEQLRRPGFYREILVERGGIESCQVNGLQSPFRESTMPLLLMQDLSIVGMFAGPDLKKVSEPTGVNVTGLTDWYRVIDWWFDKYGRYAVAVKSQDAYRRNIDYLPTPAEAVEPVMQKKMAGQRVSPEEQKALEDHLFWYAVTKATQHDLPVKLHTGYYAGDNTMPLSRLMHNAAAACDLCRAAPDTPFVFMHICYPYYEELISVAKHYTNAYVDMCWAWIINPVAAKDFLKKYLVTAPANKIVTFGGDYLHVEQVLGHALIARQGIALALSELVEEGWLNLDDALALVDPIMHENARQIFHLPHKEQALQEAPWVQS